VKLYQLLLLIAISIFIVSLLPLKFQVRYLREDKDDQLIIKIFIIKWLVFKIEFPFLKLEKHFLRPHLKIIAEVEGFSNKNLDAHLLKDKERLYLPPLEKIPRLIEIFAEKIKQYKPVAEYMLRKTSFRSLSWKTEFGLVDPVKTGILTGTIWAAKNLALRFFLSLIQTNKFRPKLQVIPQFNKSVFNSDIYCIFDIKIGHIIITSINFVVRTFFKGGKAYGGASHRRSNENRDGEHKGNG